MALLDRRSPIPQLLYFNFNQSCDCFAAGFKHGFRVLNCEPFKQMFTREFPNGGIGIVELLFRCNILALVGGGDSPKYPPNKVMIWDDHQGRAIGELSFRSEVRAVRLRKDRIAVALEHKVLVYNFADLRLVHTIETLSNPQGMMALSPSADHTVLACPGTHTGQVRVELYDTRRTKFIQAHDGGLAALALSANGKLLATASEKGTLVRVFSTAEGTKLQELRRGSEPARIYSVAFSRGENPEWLAVSSDKGTVHVFSLSSGVRGRQQAAAAEQAAAAAQQQQSSAAGQGRGGPEGASPPRANPTSKLSFVSSYLPVGGAYFSSERSFAQYRLPDTGRSLVGFGREPCTVLVLTAAGLLYRLVFDPAKGGHCDNTMQAQWMEEEEQQQGATAAAAQP